MAGVPLAPPLVGHTSVSLRFLECFELKQLGLEAGEEEEGGSREAKFVGVVTVRPWAKEEEEVKGATSSSPSSSSSPIPPPPIPPTLAFLGFGFGECEKEE